MGRVLILEPSDEIRQLIDLTVRRAGHEPLAHDGGAVEASSLAAVVLEPALPAALELARALRAERPELPLVCVSIYDRDPETVALGPSEYLVKPFRLADLESALRRAIGAGAGDDVPGR